MTKKKFKTIVDCVWKNKTKYLKESSLFSWRKEFDYPDYGYLPKRVYGNLSPEAVDAMQSIWSYVLGIDCDANLIEYEPFCSKREFARNYKERLLELGEIIK